MLFRRGSHYFGIETDYDLLLRMIKLTHTLLNHILLRILSFIDFHFILGVKLSAV
jgi:hypothetical protein